MVNRREMLAGTMAGAAGMGLSGTAGAGQTTESNIVPVLQEIQELIRTGIGPQYGNYLVQLRQAQHTHLRAAGTFPRFIEVGSDVWDQAYDWHVVNHRPIEVTRVGDRYQMPFVHSTLVLRQDAIPTYVGTPTDARQQ